MTATIIDVDMHGASDDRVRREYARRLAALSGHYAYHHESERLVEPGTPGSDVLHFEARASSPAFIAGTRYMRVDGRDQILGYSVRLDAVNRVLDETYEAALAHVEKARARERARRHRMMTNNEEI